MDMDYSSQIALVAGVSFLHTLIGPDHYVPFWSLAKAHGWSFTKQVKLITACGIAHVTASFGLMVGLLFLGHELMELAALQDMRAKIAGVGLLALGIFYVYRAFPKKAAISRWLTMGLPIFVLFLLAPCEPLISLMLEGEITGFQKIAPLFLTYMLTTIATMIGCVLILQKGLLVSDWMARWRSPVAVGTGSLSLIQHRAYFSTGLIIVGCALAITLAGL